MNGALLPSFDSSFCFFFLGCLCSPSLNLFLHLPPLFLFISVERRRQGLHYNNHKKSAWWALHTEHVFVFHCSIFTLSNGPLSLKYTSVLCVRTLLSTWCKFHHQHSKHILYSCSQRTSWFFRVRRVPGSTYLVYPGTTFLSENVVISLPLNQTLPITCP